MISENPSVTARQKGCQSARFAAGRRGGVEINCAPDCRYFVEGQKQHHKKIMQQRIRKEGAGSYVRRVELYRHNPEIFARLEMVLRPRTVPTVQSRTRI